METCMYCFEPENKQILPWLQCKICNNFVHIDCLRSKETPGNFWGDIYFEFTCANCSHGKVEIFKREKMSWLYILSITMNQLSRKSPGISKHGYFHCRTHISTFITNNWELLFDSSYKRRKNITNSFSGILSNWNNVFFISGIDLLKENGWWKISEGFSPAIIKYLYAEFSLWKQKERKNLTILADKSVEHNVMRKILADIGFEHLLNSTDEDKTQYSPEKDEQINEDSVPPSPKSEVKSDISNTGNSVDPGNSDIDDYFSNYLMDYEDSLMIGDFDDILLDFDETPDFNDVLKKNMKKIPIEQSKQLPQIKPNSNIEKSMACSSRSNYELNYDKNSPKKTTMETFIPPIKSLFSDSQATANFPWMKNSVDNLYAKTQPALTTEYSEIQALNNLNNICRKAHFTNIDKNLIRYRAKLALRRLKRNKRLPLFDVDNLVCRLSYYPTQENCLQPLRVQRVLDQFQVSNVESSYLSSALRLVSSYEVSPFISPYSGKLLKPYIWRDTETVSPWIKLMNEIKLKANKNNIESIDYVENTSLDYCYVRPQHIASINSLCEHYFWPGIDLSDSLLYPEYSCVVLYKKIVVAFAFLVPDVTLNEAYISFIFTRPGWRKCGIAGVMLYHLTQTCIDKDITLHVSASNTAVFLYQKFGFKIEEFLQEFYDKYFPPESKECRHALFLRLNRS